MKLPPVGLKGLLADLVPLTVLEMSIWETRPRIGVSYVGLRAPSPAACEKTSTCEGPLLA